jgi:NAD(P)-dependent dehydrogenase (short-subunit alcohol dehydrogenase family)
VEQRPRPARDADLIPFRRATEHTREHRDREQHILDRDMRAEPARRLLTLDDRSEELVHPLRERHGTRIVLVRDDEVDEARRDDRLVDDAVDEVVERRLRMLEHRLEAADIVIEHGDGEREPVGEVPVETPLPDAGAAGDEAQGRCEPFGREDLACGGDERAPILGAGARPAIPFRRGGHSASVPIPDSVVRMPVPTPIGPLMAQTPLTGDSSVGTWLDDPIGGAIFRELLAEAGQDASVLKPVRRLALKRLVKLSKGRFSEELIDQLVARAASGDVPTTDAASGVSTEQGVPADEAAPFSATPEGVERPEWVERISDGRFTGKTVIVTGAGSGIGRATASRIAREGGRVIAVDISEERLAEFAAEFPAAGITTVVADITDDAAIARIIAAAGGTIDALANVAGIMDNMTPVHEIDDAIWKRVFAINVDGTMKLMRAVIPGMLARAQGSIVNVASEAALRGSAAGAAYTASKHAVVGLTKSSAFMYGPSGLRVNAVAPGPVITNIEASFDSPLGADRVRTGMMIMPDAVEGDALAASITFLLSDDGVNVNGQILASDGGWSAA